MTMMKERIYRHHIEPLHDAVRVTKHHHTYFLEGELARQWWDGYLRAEGAGILDRFLDGTMLELGQYPV